MQFVCPNIFSLPSDPAKAEECKGKLEIALTTFENSFLCRGKFIICGDDISVADLKSFCELTQLWMTDYKPYVDGSKTDV